jgi:thiosulfate/3-mercaptopyruvate sulfurtransferase
MKLYSRFFVAFIFLCCTVTFAPTAGAQSSLAARSVPGSPVGSATQLTANQLIQPEALVAWLQTSKSPKPLLLQVGFRVLYVQAHIPGSEYVAAGSSAGGLQQLRARVEKLPRNKAIVLYCGCCPWTHCPNVQGAYQEVHSMGFTNVKVLYIAHDFGTDWVSKGYPVETGQ